MCLLLNDKATRMDINRTGVVLQCGVAELKISEILILKSLFFLTVVISGSGRIDSARV